MHAIRIEKLSKKLTYPCLIEQEADLLYLTGLELSKGRLLVDPHGATLFVDGRYYDIAKKKAPCKVALWDEQKKLTHPKIGFDSASVCYDGFLQLKKNCPEVEWIPMSNPLKTVRALKSYEEIQALKQAAEVTYLGIRHVEKNLAEGVSEAELAMEFEFFCRKLGASGLSFEPIIAFGENSAYPHYRAGEALLKKGQVVLVDVGAIVGQYHGDMTRVFHFGTPNPRIVEFERIVRGAQEKAMQQIRPGVKAGELDQIVHDEFDRFHVKPLYIHSLGHGIGLETHEFPRLRFDGEDKDVILEEGMVMTIEPGLYQPGLGGVRIEDMIVVTKHGYERLIDAQ